MSWTMACSLTWDPTTKRLLICFSILCNCSWSSREVNPSAPFKFPDIAADIVDTLNNLSDSFTS
ncbi:hypothetical protein BpHYR1_000526 [Brachionus plicatilis]|uniref:Uncharacterized protein n=1 Tax=Brachionus plicatilis TaxID=10195 RepID=A0A3M7R4C6_BRAPC|nr:hypothetical protein BpHYR1_000526 [Brachionus plicatilis]